MSKGKGYRARLRRRRIKRNLKKKRVKNLTMALEKDNTFINKMIQYARRYLIKLCRDLQGLSK